MHARGIRTHDGARAARSRGKPERQVAASAAAATSRQCRRQPPGSVSAAPGPRSRRRGRSDPSWIAPTGCSARRGDSAQRRRVSGKDLLVDDTTAGRARAVRARGRMRRARHRDEDEEEAQDDGPQGEPIGPGADALGRPARRATAIDLDQPGQRGSADGAPGDLDRPPARWRRERRGRQRKSARRAQGRRSRRARRARSGRGGRRRSARSDACAARSRPPARSARSVACAAWRRVRGRTPGHG